MAFRPIPVAGLSWSRAAARWITCVVRAPVPGRSGKPCRSWPRPSRTAAPSPATTSWRCWGPAAGLAILDTLAASSRLARWPQLHIARGALLAQCGRHEDAGAAYRDAIALEPSDAVRRHITGQIAALGAAHPPTEET
jgi:hypothetical protein